MTRREQWELTERQILSPSAALVCASEGRERPEEPCPYRTDFQRDRDRILHCKAFRRLKHKTQVFLSPEGDHYRTRLTHTLEVSQIARTAARALRLNEDLTEAISLGHDLGHTPFGHAGERALDVYMEGGFRHYEQGVRVVERIERDGAGLNLTAEVREGIARHTCDPLSRTLEGQLVRMADRIAYINHDIDDALRAGVLFAEDIPVALRQVLGETPTERIDTMVTSLVENSGARIAMSDAVAAATDRLHEFLFDSVYRNPVAKGEETKVDGIIGQLFAYYVAHPDKMPQEYAGIRERDGVQRAVCDYVSGMTDTYALEVYSSLFIPRSWAIHIER